MAQYSFVNPQLQINTTPQKKSLNDGRLHLFLSTNDGELCGYWRSRFISLALEAKYTHKCSFADGKLLISDPNLLLQADSYRIGRFCQEPECRWIKYFKQTTRGNVKLLYDIDDILIADDIPEYNLFKECFRNTEKYLHFAMSESNIITTTSTYLRDYYVGKLQLAPEKFAVIPNYPPRWLFDNYHPELIAARCERRKKRQIRIGIAASGTHFTPDKRVADDCSVIADWIIRNRKKYKFVFKGGISSYFEPYAGDFEIHEGDHLLFYPKAKMAMDVDIMVQPLQDNLFNRCKSLIKFYESWGDGTPCFVSNVANYFEAAPECCFHDVADLESRIETLCNSDPEYMKVAENNYKRMATLYLEENLDKWLEVML